MSNVLSRRLAELDGAYIAVGLAGPHPSGLDAADLGRILSEGTQDGHIPARDFMGPAVEGAALAVKKALREAQRAALKGQSPIPAMRRGAEAAHSSLVRVIDTFDTPGNADATIRKKGKDDPLVDKGDLLDLTFSEYALGDLARGQR